MAKRFTIPKKDRELFKTFLDLDIATKDVVYNFFNTTDIGLAPSNIVEKLYETLNGKIDIKQARNIIRMYLILINTYNALEFSSLENFFPVLQETFERDLPGLLSKNSAFEDLMQLLKSSSSLIIAAKVAEAQAEQEKVFIGMKTFQDVRPVFDDNGDLLGSSITHTLKITYSENDEEKYFYIVLDNQELKEIQCKLEKAADRIESIKSIFTNVKIMNER